VHAEDATEMQALLKELGKALLGGVRQAAN